MAQVRPGRGWLRPRLGLLGVACTALLATTMPASPAVSAARGCPATVPMAGVTKGMAVHGLTVTSGTTPDTFKGTVLGVLKDGIAPGLDMIMVQLSGSQITDSQGNVDKGIWAGMSGSPVYAANGRLLGAVSYGLSYAPSDVAGLTPAVEMMKLINGRSVTAKPRGSASVSIPKAAANRLVASGTLRSSQATGGFQRLPMPFSVSGVSSRALARVAHRFNIKRPLVASGGTSSRAAASTIVPGGNLAAALSYGDAAWYGVGTTTAVCGSNVLGFGHPMLWSGRSSLSMHGGDAIYIQKDQTFGSFKVANLSAPVGRLVGDHLEGINGVLGASPPMTQVSSHVTATNGNSRNGRTEVAYRPYLPDIAATHLYSNALRVLDKMGSGSATVQWTLKGTRADGSPWSFTYQDKFASHWDIAFESSWESYRQLSKILRNRFERVQITSVHYDASYQPRFHALTLTSVEVKPGATWVPLSRRKSTPVNAGADLPVRATLLPSKGVGGPVVVNLAVHIPRSASGAQAELLVQGGPGSSRLHVTSFGQLLSKLASAPGNDAVTATLFTDVKGGRGGAGSDSQQLSQVVSGDKYGSLSVR